MAEGGYDPCECVYSYEGAMRRLVGLVSFFGILHPLSFEVVLIFGSHFCVDDSCILIPL